LAYKGKSPSSNRLFSSFITQIAPTSNRIITPKIPLNLLNTKLITTTNHHVRHSEHQPRQLCQPVRIAALSSPAEQLLTGFSSTSPKEEVREIASKGGQASHSGGFASMDPDKQVQFPFSCNSSSPPLQFG
jgi:hypothetical protein